MKKIIFLLMAILIVVPVFSLEITRGKIKVVLDEAEGSFAVFDVSDRGRAISLLSDEDHSTTALYILVNDRIFHLGKNSSFRQSVEEGDDHISFIWTSSILKITQKFSFINSNNNATASGFKMEINIENLSETAANVGVRIMLDTYLSENSNAHFVLSSGDELTKERSYTSSFPQYWVSGTPGEGTALQVMLNQRGSTEPSQVVFANWKRLDSANWAYNSRTRNFNYLPYSVNDSAVSQWYETQSLASGDNRTISLLLGLYDSSGLSDQVATTTADIVSEAGPVSSGSPRTTEVNNVIIELRDDLAKVNFVLGEFDKVIMGDQDVSIEDIDSLESLVKELEERYQQYQDQ